MPSLLKTLMFFLAVGSLLSSCEMEAYDRVSNDPADWLVDRAAIFDDGAEADGIPAINAPEFVSVAEADLGDDELVVGVVINGEARAYPHSILNWHEIVNDVIDDEAIAITYSPLTGTAIGYRRVIGGEPTEFGVSGLLFNANLIPFDRATGSHWSQVQRRSIEGELIGADATTVPVVETTWETWRSWYPETTLLSRNTGFERNYGYYPYGEYRTSDELIFPLQIDDRRRHRKDRGLGVINSTGEAAYFPLDGFYRERARFCWIGDEPFIVVGSQQHGFIVAFEAHYEDGTPLVMDAANSVDSLDMGSVFEDMEGNTWTAFGLASSGPRRGQRLTRAESFMGYWLAFGSFFADIRIVEP